MKNALLLNADWSPLNFITGFRALNLLFKCRAEIISMGDRYSTWDEKVTTASRSYELPATLRLVHRVNRRYTAPRFRKKVLFNRDNWQCQYCDVKLDRCNITIDHVIPRSRGGETSWRNCVTSCKKCNYKKGSRMLSEIDMKLIRLPVEPKVVHFWEYQGRSHWHPDWSHFFNRSDDRY